MSQSLQTLARSLLVFFAVIAVTTGYWVLVRGDQLLAREDNPRLVLAEQEIRRGAIVDRNDVPLATTVMSESPGLTSRRYPYPSATSVIGYYSLRYGVSGIEATYDDLLRGDIYLTEDEATARQLLHEQQFGGDVRLTIDYALQEAVAESLEAYRGAVVVVSVPDGEILALVSQPTFDPNTLDDTWDTLSEDEAAPLFNRATQGRYQPGAVLQPVIYGAALNMSLITSAQEWYGSLEADVDGITLPCAGNPDVVNTIDDALLWGCPGPFLTLGQDMIPTLLDDALESFGLLEFLDIALPTTEVDFIVSPALTNPGRTALGQSRLTVTPLQMARVAAAFANSGEAPPLHIIDATRAPGDVWQSVPGSDHYRGTISRTNAEAVSTLMAQSVLNGSSRAARIRRQRVSGHTGLAVSGPEGTLNAWFIGYVLPTDGPMLAVAVLIEDVTSAEDAARIGGEALDAALRATEDD